ncbi:hypothetical protein GF314_14660, partial [bacterium]|nr:hypothetical protein [bacterium]
MKRDYKKPELLVEPIQLGAYGDYGDNIDGPDVPEPIRVIRRFNMR